MQTGVMPETPMKRPRPSVAPCLLAGNAEEGSVYRDSVSSYSDPQHLSTAGTGRGSWAEPPQATRRSAY